MYSGHNYWTFDYITNIWRQAGSHGGILLVSNGATGPQKRYFDAMMFDACQVTNPSIDPLREPMEIRTYLGKKPDRFGGDMGPQLRLEVPIMFGAMSFGALNLRVHEAEARATQSVGTFWNTGEGGFHRSLRKFGANTIVQVASGRFGVSEDYLKSAAAVEIKIGQGAKPGIGGHLPGEKVSAEISETRMIPEGSDALSPAPHHDIYSIEDLRQLIFAIKEATEYRVPVLVKIAAVHNVAPIASGVARAGADIIAIDGFRGGSEGNPVADTAEYGYPHRAGHCGRRPAPARRRNTADGEPCRIRWYSMLVGLAESHLSWCRCSVRGNPGACRPGMRHVPALFSGKCAYGITTNKPGLAERINVDEATEALVSLAARMGGEKSGN